MKSKYKEVYYCDFCNKHGLHKGHMTRHEQLCTRNPENKRPCFNCVHLDLKTATAVEFLGDDTNISKVKVFFCSKLKSFLHTPKNEAKGNRFELEEGNNNPMPKECDTFSDNYNGLIY